MTPANHTSQAKTQAAYSLEPSNSQKTVTRSRAPLVSGILRTRSIPDLRRLEAGGQPGVGGQNAARQPTFADVVKQQHKAFVPALTNSTLSRTTSCSDLPRLLVARSSPNLDLLTSATPSVDASSVSSPPPACLPLTSNGSYVNVSAATSNPAEPTPKAKSRRKQKKSGGKDATTSTCGALIYASPAVTAKPVADASVHQPKLTPECEQMTRSRSCSHCKLKRGCCRQNYDNGQEVAVNVILTDRPCSGCRAAGLACDFIGLRLPCERCRKDHPESESECVQDPKNPGIIYLGKKQPPCTRCAAKRLGCKICPRPRKAGEAGEAVVVAKPSKRRAPARKRAAPDSGYDDVPRHAPPPPRFRPGTGAAADVTAPMAYFSVPGAPEHPLVHAAPAATSTAWPSQPMTAFAASAQELPFPDRQSPLSSSLSSAAGSTRSDAMLPIREETTDIHAHSVAQPVQRQHVHLAVPTVFTPFGSNFDALSQQDGSWFDQSALPADVPAVGWRATADSLDHAFTPSALREPVSELSPRDVIAPEEGAWDGPSWIPELLDPQGWLDFGFGPQM